jgi:parallel beta-helix repeat protein
MSYNAGTAMRLTSSPSANITGNYFAHNIIGMSLMSSDNSSTTSSTFYWNNVQGMGISSNNVTISKNVIALNGAGFSCCGGKVATIRANNFTIDGLSLGYFPSPQPLSYTVTTDNLVNGKPLRFYSGCSNLDINGISVGELILMNCNNVRITNLKIFYSVVGIELANVNNTLITSNSLNSNTYAGISLMGNNITVTGNNISNNWVRALDAVSTTGLLAYHNNFFYNEITDAGLNYRIDNGYPSGGNYWARYTGADNCSGPNQNICPNPDGIGDTTYYFPDCCSTNPTSVGDRYPLMRPYLLTPDTSPPGWLPNMQLTVSAISQTQATLYWMGAADDVGVVSYLVYSGSTLITNISADIAPHNLPFKSQYILGTGYRYVAGNLIAGTAYTFKIVAVDEAGNRSVAVLTATFSTQPPSVFSLAWWQLYWYLVALAGGAVAAVIVVFWMKWRKRVLPPPSIVTPDPSNLTR